MDIEHTYSAQNARLQPEQSAGERLVVSDGFAIQDSRLGLLHDCAAQRSSWGEELAVGGAARRRGQ